MTRGMNNLEIDKRQRSEHSNQLKHQSNANSKINNDMKKMTENSFKMIKTRRMPINTDTKSDTRSQMNSDPYVTREVQ